MFVKTSITKIETQGRAHSFEFVKEYSILYAVNELDYSYYKENDGSNKVFSFVSFCVMFLNFIVGIHIFTYEKLCPVVLGLLALSTINLLS